MEQIYVIQLNNSSDETPNIFKIKSTKTKDELYKEYCEHNTLFVFVWTELEFIEKFGGFKYDELKFFNNTALEFNVYDMLVFEDKVGGIYQDCVNSITTFKDEPIMIWCNCASISLHPRTKTIKEIKWVDVDENREESLKLKEIWTRSGSNTYKKVFELVDDEYKRIDYYAVNY